MRTKFVKHILLFVTAFTLSACGFFDKDNTPDPTPLKPYTAEVHPRVVWSTNTGSGGSNENLRLSPAITANAIYTSNTNGYVTAVNKTNGVINWQINTKIYLSSSPGAGDGIVVVGSRHGDIVALAQTDGHTLWKASVPGELLAAPAIDNGMVIIKAIDGYIVALSTRDGHEVWSFQQAEPSLLLRGASSPVIHDGSVFIGFANGNLAKLGANNGQIAWMTPIAIAQGAFSIERMIDIDADPVVDGHRVFAATYQGQVASLAWGSGAKAWSHDISSYTGMVPDSNTLYITDAKGHVWAFGIDNGLVNWRQTQLEARVLSGPALMGRYVVVGDAEGYLHWLSTQDGHIGGRVSVGSAITAAPVVENNTVYVLTNSGYLTAYTLS